MRDIVEFIGRKDNHLVEDTRTRKATEKLIGNLYVLFLVAVIASIVVSI